MYRAKRIHIRKLVEYAGQTAVPQNRLTIVDTLFQPDLQMAPFFTFEVSPQTKLNDHRSHAV